LKRRGYTPEAINDFCDKISITRRGNEMIVPFHLLEYCIRKDLNFKAKRTMGVINPIKLILTNVSDDFELKLKAPYFPMIKDSIEKGGYYEISLKKEIWVEKDDVRKEDHPKFFGFAPNKIVGLKYAGIVKVEEMIIDKETGEVKEIHA